MDWRRYSNPMAVVHQDLVDALDHTQQLIDRPLRLDEFHVGPVRTVPMEELESWDDLGSWPEWGHGELIELLDEERVNELAGFRGAAWAVRASHWTQSSIPPIVLVETKEGYRTIGDGRGRVSYAIGMAFSKLPAVVLQEWSLPGST